MRAHLTAKHVRRSIDRTHGLYCYDGGMNVLRGVRIVNVCTASCGRTDLLSLHNMAQCKPMGSCSPRWTAALRMDSERDEWGWDEAHGTEISSLQLFGRGAARRSAQRIRRASARLDQAFARFLRASLSRHFGGDTTRKQLPKPGVAVALPCNPCVSHLTSAVAR